MTYAFYLSLEYCTITIASNSSDKDLTMARIPRVLITMALVLHTLGDRYPDCISGPLASNDVCRMGLDPTTRAKALVAAMTTEEKLVNMVEYGNKPLMVHAANYS